MTGEIPTTKELRKISPNEPVTIKVPESGFWEQEAETITTEHRFLEGDLDAVYINSPFAGIRFEKDNFDDQPEYLQEISNRGARVFVTESDSWLVIHSEKSLQYKEKLQKSKLLL